ncbi:MAG: hypothetical protein AAF456_10380 [Planctomycetota bacterium]
MPARWLTILLTFSLTFLPAAGLTGTCNLSAQETESAPEVVDADPGQEESAEESSDGGEQESTEDSSADAIANEAPGSEHLLPASTQFWLSVPDIRSFEENFNNTGLGALTQEESFKPFVDTLRGQVEDWLNEKNVRLGAKVEDLEQFAGGEICMAGILQKAAGDEALGRGSHGVVLLVNVGDDTGNAEKLLEKIDAEFEEREGTREERDINGKTVTVWKVERPNRVVKTRSTFYVIENGWVLASDNEEIFRQILLRVSNPDAPAPEEALAIQAPFQTIMERTTTQSVSSDARWYVNPFGYIELAQAIEAEEQQFRQKRDNWAQDLREQGFDSFGGVGGQFAFATDDHELLHRTFVFAPRKELTDEKHQQVFNLVDFENRDNRPLDPPAWIADDAAAFTSGVWDMSKAIDNVGVVVDMFAGEDAWEGALADFKAEMGLDVRKWVGQFDNQMIVMSRTVKPIGDSSEQVAIFMPFQPNENDMLDSINTVVGQNGEKLVIAGFDVLEVVNTVQEEPLEDIPDIFLEEEDPDGNVSEEFNLFETSYFVVYKDHLLIVNNRDFLREIITSRDVEELAEARDYLRVKESLQLLTDDDRISFRQFGRMDRIMKTNYQMVRNGDMAQANTVLARVLNRILQDQDEELDDREQKLDGSGLPEDYEAAVAPYFGPSGWVMETLDDGWRITGVLLKKKELNEMVQRPEDGVNR